MSIPKEPRQLMVNLMYLVLTALLALNVSAEIMNAFFTIDRGLNESSQVVERSNEQLMAAIQQQAEAYSQYEVYQNKATKAQQLSATFYDEVEKIRQQIIEEAGGLGEDNLPVRKRDKDITTRLLITEGKGDSLKNRIMQVREAFLGLIDEEAGKQILANAIPLNIPPVPQEAKTQDWATFTFKQMPVAAVLPMLAKFQNDVKITQTTLLNYFLEKMNAQISKPDAFVPVISAEQSYVIRGEEYLGEIFLAAYSTTADNLKVSVDGIELPVENGKAVFRERARSNGSKKRKMEIDLENPITGEIETFEKEFTYVVGERSVTVSADKMNVMYIGVDNPISISAAGVPSSEVEVSATGTTLSKRGNGYVAKPTRPGVAEVTVSGGGLKPTKFKFRVKRIPDPVVKLGNKKGGEIKKAEFKVQQGLLAVMENFDFDARCRVQGFEVVQVPKNSDVRTAMNEGGRFGSAARSVIDNADRGDLYYFDKIKVRCPGDQVGRSMNPLVFKIK
jgi:gliding motility-associated protein GldM